MDSLFRQIIALLLLSGYVAGSEATLLRLMDIRLDLPGKEAVKEGGAKGQEPRRPAWTQRRHLPLVVKLALSLTGPSAFLVPQKNPTFSHFPRFDRFPRSGVDFFGARCNKAPPQV